MVTYNLFSPFQFLSQDLVPHPSSHPTSLTTRRMAPVTVRVSSSTISERTLSTKLLHPPDFLRVPLRHSHPASYPGSKCQQDSWVCSLFSQTTASIWGAAIPQTPVSAFKFLSCWSGPSLPLVTSPQLISTFLLLNLHGDPYCNVTTPARLHALSALRPRPSLSETLQWFAQSFPEATPQ